MAIFYKGNGQQVVVQEPNGNTELTYVGVSDAWIANAEIAYNLLQAEVQKLSYSAVPFFVQTDLHNANNAPARWLHNKDKSIKNINLGDICDISFNATINNTYRDSAMPVDNLITVLGNHDASTRDGWDVCTSHGLNYYYTDTTKGKRMVNERSFFTVCDDDYNVKYVVISPYYMGEDGSRSVAEVKTDQMTWLLNELSIDDGYDIVILMHQLFTDTHYHRDGSLQDWADAPVVLESLWTVMKDRRNKRSGTITDSEGVQHSYDFTNVKSRILGSLHGHTHEELMLTEEKMTAYATNGYMNEHACVFGIFDRKNNKLKVWEFSNTGVLDVLELDI